MATASASIAACTDVGSPSCVVPYSHARSSRSWRLAIVVIRRGSVVRCISTSDCSTESCRWAARIARSSSLMRAARSSSSRRNSRPIAGATKMARPPTTTAMAAADLPTLPSPPVRLASDATPATTRISPATTCNVRVAMTPNVGRLPLPSDHATEIPTAIAAAGIMIPSPGHRPIIRQTTSTAPVAHPIASSRRQRSGASRRGGVAPGTASVEVIAASP